MIHRLASLFAVALAIASLTSCMDTRHRILVSVHDQQMVVFDQGKPLRQFPISTSRFTLSNDHGTHGTPLGLHEIAEKHGGGQPLGMKLVDRIPTGEIVPIDSPGRDPIVTRILWLRGLEPWNNNSYDRYIYIHGTPQESLLGRPASYGCVRMRSVDVAWLYDLVGIGAKVNIVREPLAMHWNWAAGGQ